MVRKAHALIIDGIRREGAIESVQAVLSQLPCVQVHSVGVVITYVLADAKCEDTIRAALKSVHCILTDYRPTELPADQA